jgi:hypothetical protein
VTDRAYIPPARYEIALREGPKGSDVAAYGDIKVQTRHGAVPALARAMLAAGYPNGSWAVNGGNIFGPSLVGVAKWSFTEAGKMILWEPVPSLAGVTTSNSSPPCPSPHGV